MAGGLRLSDSAQDLQGKGIPRANLEAVKALIAAKRLAGNPLDFRGTLYGLASREAVSSAVQAAGNNQIMMASWNDMVGLFGAKCAKPECRGLYTGVSVEHVGRGTNVRGRATQITLSCDGGIKQISCYSQMYIEVSRDKSDVMPKEELGKVINAVKSYRRWLPRKGERIGRERVEEIAPEGLRLMQLLSACVSIAPSRYTAEFDGFCRMCYADTKITIKGRRYYTHCQSCAALVADSAD